MSPVLALGYPSNSLLLSERVHSWIHNVSPMRTVTIGVREGSLLFVGYASPRGALTDASAHPFLGVKRRKRAVELRAITREEKLIDSLLCNLYRELGNYRPFALRSWRLVSER